MSEVNWLFGKTLNEKSLVIFEKRYNYSFSKNFITFIQQANGAYPSKQSYNGPREELCFSSVLSFNEDDADSAFKIAEIFYDLGTLKCLPFGSNGFGDYLCLKGEKVVLWNHESEKEYLIAESLEKFLDLLY